MRNSRFATLSLILVFLFNAALLATLFVATGDVLHDRLGLLIGAGLGFSLALWFVLQRLGRPAAKPESAAPDPTPEEPTPAEPEPPSPAPAVQMLSILQRKGRLIDFLQEDIQQYEDAQIGAAVRTVHDGCREALREHVELEPIFADNEGESVTVEPGFDAQSIRLTGSVTGDPPFTGTLQHRGWRVKSIDLPQQMQSPDDNAMVVAAAEVEVQ